MRSTRKRCFPLGCLCAEMRLGEKQKYDDAILRIRASSTDGPAVDGFACEELCHLLVAVSPGTLSATQCPFYVRQKRCGNLPKYFLLLVSQLA